MSFLNIEIKAHCRDPLAAEHYLLNTGARLAGIDVQEDTYYNVPEGRLKLRQGRIENNLIFYRRTDQEGPKASSFLLHPVTDGPSLHALLSESLGVKITVKKNRKIFFLDHTKFHIDEVPGWGNFIEIEVSNLNHPFLTEASMQADCRRYMSDLGIREKDLVAGSYSDMLMEREKK